MKCCFQEESEIRTIDNLDGFTEDAKELSVMKTILICLCILSF